MKCNIWLGVSSTYKQKNGPVVNVGKAREGGRYWRNESTVQITDSGVELLTI